MLSLAPDRENAHFSENSCHHLRTGKLLIKGSRPRKLESELTKLPKPRGDRRQPCRTSLSRRTGGVSNGLIQFKSARKIWPLLELLAKITRVLVCSCSQNFCNCSHARIFVNMCSITRNLILLCSYFLYIYRR